MIRDMILTVPSIQASASINADTDTVMSTKSLLWSQTTVPPAFPWKLCGQT